MSPRETMARLLSLVSDREQQAKHAEAVRKQLAEDRARRLKAQQRAAVRGITLAGHITT